MQNSSTRRRTHARILIDTVRYPIENPKSRAYKDIVDTAHQSFTQSGSISLPGFLSTEGIDRLQEEARARIPDAAHSTKMENAYGVPADEAMPADHPYRILGQTDRHGVAYHQMQDSSLADLYRWPPIRQLVADVTGHRRLYLHEDPSNALVLQIFPEGGRLAWHFDRAGFSCIIQLQAAEEGGEFEYVRALRSPEDECFDEVKAILLGDSTRVERRSAEPGTFSIFNGTRTLHRVTPVRGSRARMSLVLSYEDRPGVKLDVATRKRFFGPDAPDDD